MVADLVFGVNGHCDVRLRLFLLFRFTHTKMINKDLLPNRQQKTFKSSLQSFKQWLTWSGHLDTHRLLTWLADSCRIVGSDTEAVLSQRVQARADVVRCVFTTACHFSPAHRLVQALLFDLHNVALHSFASVVAGTRPGQDQRLTRQLGNDRLRRWWVRLV